MEAVLAIFAALLIGTVVMRLLAWPVTGAPGTWMTSLATAASAVLASWAAGALLSLAVRGATLAPGALTALALSVTALLLTPVVRAFLRTEAGTLPNWGQATAIAALYIVASVMVRLLLSIAE